MAGAPLPHLLVPWCQSVRTGRNVGGGGAKGGAVWGYRSTNSGAGETYVHFVCR